MEFGSGVITSCVFLLPELHTSAALSDPASWCRCIDHDLSLAFLSEYGTDHKCPYRVGSDGSPKMESML